MGTVQQGSLSSVGLEASFGALILPGFLFLKMYWGDKALGSSGGRGVLVTQLLPFPPAHLQPDDKALCLPESPRPSLSVFLICKMGVVSFILLRQKSLVQVHNSLSETLRLSVFGNFEAFGFHKVLRWAYHIGCITVFPRK